MADDKDTTPQDDTGGEDVSNEESGKGQEQDTSATKQTDRTEENDASKSAEQSEDKATQKTEGEADKPVTYQEFKVPDGIVADKSLLAEFKTLAGKMKLSQEQAQELVNLQAKTVKAQTEQFAKVRQGWLEEIYGDSDFGGDKIKRTTDEARLALQEYDEDDKLKKLMVETGFQDNPDVLRFLARVGRERKKEGKILKGNRVSPDEEIPLADRLWPDMK